MSTMTIRLLDGTGDTEQVFDVNDKTAMEVAEALFKRLQSQGNVAFRETPGGEGGGLQENFQPGVSVAFSPLAYPG